MCEKASHEENRIFFEFIFLKSAWDLGVRSGMGLNRNIIPFRRIMTSLICWLSRAPQRYTLVCLDNAEYGRSSRGVEGNQAVKKLEKKFAIETVAISGF